MTFTKFEGYQSPLDRRNRDARRLLARMYRDARRDERNAETPAAIPTWLVVLAVLSMLVLFNT